MGRLEKVGHHGCPFTDSFYIQWRIVKGINCISITMVYIILIRRIHRKMDDISLFRKQMLVGFQITTKQSNMETMEMPDDLCGTGEVTGTMMVNIKSKVKFHKIYSCFLYTSSR
jgi:hypothetical protein